MKAITQTTELEHNVLPDSTNLNPFNTICGRQITCPNGCACNSKLFKDGVLFKSTHINSLKQRCLEFIEFLKIENVPSIEFVEKEGVNEYKVNEYFDGENTLYFNILFFNEMEVNYVLLILLHEIVHFSEQGVKDFSDVNTIRDNNNWSFMQLFDVHADLRVVDFLRKTTNNFSFKTYVRLLYKGVTVFRDKKIRYPKLERFVGSLTSIYYFFYSGKNIVLLPKLQSGNSFLAKVNFSKGHFEYLPLEMKEELSKWEFIFQHAALFTEEEYITQLTNLSQSFINLTEYK
jgi:hypothetical protein